MDQIKHLFESLGWKQFVSLVLVAGAVLAGLTSFAHWNRERDFRPLYSELSQEDAAAVLAKVRESGNEFRLAENGSAVLVPSSKVAELRLQLAAAGVPKSGRIGFELFDKTNFGASDFAEQVNYHRALEGELERSVMALAAVEQARVHITLARDSVYLDSKQPAKASVLVKLRAGAQLSAQNVAAICQLAASAVEGLAPEAVSVVDMRGNLLNRARKPASADEGEPSEAALDYRQKIEHDLLAKIDNTLTPLLGEDRFRATASAECDFSSAEQSDETFDPSKSVMVTSQKTEDITGGGGVTAGGVPGTASNLPKPPARVAGSSGGVARRTENISYQSSRSVRRVRTPEGTVKRLSVALLVDSEVRWEGTGPTAKRIVEAPSAEKLKTIHDLVVGVIGLNAERGDQLVIETLPFESTLNPEPIPAGGQRPAPAVPPAADPLLKSKYLPVAGGVAAVVILGLVFLVFKLSRGGKRKAGPAEMSPQLPAAGADDFNQQVQKQIAEQAALRQQQEMEALNALKLPVATKKTEVLTKHIGEQAKKDSTAMAHVLRSWMSEGKA